MNASEVLTDIQQGATITETVIKALQFLLNQKAEAVSAAHPELGREAMAHHDALGAADVTGRPQPSAGTSRAKKATTKKAPAAAQA